MANKTEVLAILKKESNQTANAIGKALGMTKASSGLRSLIESMVGSELVADNSGRYTTYSLAVAKKVEPASPQYRTIKSNPGLTMNALGKLFGYSKAPKSFKASVEDLVKSGDVVEDNSGRYSTYSVAGSQVVTTTTVSPNRSKAAPTQQKVAAPGKLESVTVNGYSMSSSGNGSVKVKCPSQNSITLKDGEYLLVINDEPLWAVKTAKDVLRCFASYAADKNYATYVVKNAVTGRIIGDVDDKLLGEDRILMVEIKRHNKAA